jgi:hypothetical protein
MGFIERELERIREELAIRKADHTTNEYRQLYAAQQA